MFNLKWRNKIGGFTLIELLVVISIISLLSTVVMASLQTARTKAQEAAIKSDLHSIKTQAELSYSKVGDYSLVEQTIDPILKHINVNGGTANFMSSYLIYLPYEQYVPNYGYKQYSVSVKLNSDTTKNWSVSDSGNVAKWDIKDTKKDGTEGSENMNWNEAAAACSISGGRLPTIEELKAFWDAHGTIPPNMNSGYFWYYWSYTTFVGNEGDGSAAWIVRVSDGHVDLGNKRDLATFVRCVH